MAFNPGDLLADHLRVIRTIGSGATGVVYEAEHLAIRRRVAVKVLREGAHDDARRRFELEAAAAGRVGSEHLNAVLDIGEAANGAPMIVMDLLIGKTLTTLMLERGPMDPREIAPIAIDLLTGLDAAHRAGIIHRDVKPSNIFLAEREGRTPLVKLIDFGVSKFNELGTGPETQEGAVLGTPFYMAPEQARGVSDIDGRADLYSVGVVLYQAVTGRVPFHAPTFNELIFKIAIETPLPPEAHSPGLDPAFGNIVRKAMSRAPADRYRTALDLRAALAQFLSSSTAKGLLPEQRDRPTLTSASAARAVPWKIVSIGVLVTVLIGVAGLLAFAYAKILSPEGPGDGSAAVVSTAPEGPAFVKSASAKTEPEPSAEAPAEPSATPAGSSPTALPSTADAEGSAPGRRTPGAKAGASKVPAALPEQEEGRVISPDL